MLTGSGLRVPAALESGVSTFQAMLFPSDPWFTASSVDWYDPVEPAAVNLPALGFEDGTASENVTTPFPKLSIWFTEPVTFAVLRSKSVAAPLAATMPSRVPGFRTPNSPTQMLGAAAPMTPFRSLAVTSGRVIVVVAVTKVVRDPRLTM